MKTLMNPADIAREALKRLTAANLAPTPANFQACYNQIAKLPVKAPFPTVQLQKIAAALPAKSAERKALLASLDAAIAGNSWRAVELALMGYINALAADGIDTKDSSSSVLPSAFSNELAKFLEGTLPALGDPTERGPRMLGEVVQTLRNPPVVIQKTQESLANAAKQILISAEEQGSIKTSLLKLIHLMLENISQISLDESWLRGQVEGLLGVVEPPISLRHLDDMERRLREVMVKQGEARRQSIQAREEMRTMLATFVESLAIMNDSSASFQEKIELSAQKIKVAKRIDDLGPVLQEVIEATRTMSEGTAQARNQLRQMQDKVVATEATLTHLHEQLDKVSAQARHDPLTDALNRKGLDDALCREIANVQRRNLPLSVCLLDLDNFKKLNDRLGHETGDKALIHLANVARQCLRPNDTLARYGGEEFVILMPDTMLCDGIEIMTRLQRELTKVCFLSGKENILITFSAGVAQVGRDESGIEAINRADQAMYLAKRAGKNRVVGG